MCVNSPAETSPRGRTQILFAYGRGMTSNRTRPRAARRNSLTVKALLLCLLAITVEGTGELPFTPASLEEAIAAFLRTHV